MINHIKKVMALLLLISLVCPVAAKDEPEVIYSVQYGFYQQLVVDLAIDTLQELSSASATPADFVVLREKLIDIRLKLSEMTNLEEAGEVMENEHVEILMSRLSQLDGILRFHQLPADKKNASLGRKRPQHIAELLLYLRQQSYPADFLTDKSLLDLTENREARLDGRWKLIDTVRGGRYDGLKISFQIQIQENHVTIEAEGEKIRENDIEVSAKHRSLLKVYGYIKNNVIRAAFSEQGLHKNLSGEFVWLVLNDRLLSGIFISSTGATGGSVLIKADEESVLTAK